MAIQIFGSKVAKALDRPGPAIRRAKVKRIAETVKGSRNLQGKKKLAFLGFGKKKAEAAPTPEKGKKKRGIVGRGRAKAKEARRKKLIAAGFTAAEAAEMEP